MYSEPSRTSNIELFANIVKGYLLLTIFAKISMLGVLLGSKYVSEIFMPFMNEKVCRYTKYTVRVHMKIIP